MTPSDTNRLQLVSGHRLDCGRTRWKQKDQLESFGNNTEDDAIMDWSSLNGGSEKLTFWLCSEEVSTDFAEKTKVRCERERGQEDSQV